MDNPMLVVIGILVIIGLIVLLVNEIMKKHGVVEENKEVQTEEDIAKDYVDSILVKTEVKEEKKEKDD